MISVEPGFENASSPKEAYELLKQVLRLEYTGITYLPHLSSAAQHSDIGFCLTILCNNSIEHAVILASVIRELGGTPDWTVTVPAENDTLIRLFEIQLARERLCYQLYERSARLLEGSHLSTQLITMACDELHHIELIEFVLNLLAEQKHEIAPIRCKRTSECRVVFPCNTSDN